MEANGIKKILALFLSIVTLSLLQFHPVFAQKSTFTDSRDGKEYKMVFLGGQWWMAENLNVGTMISTTEVQTNNGGVIEKYCYDNLEENCSQYGGLYRWDEAMNYTYKTGDSDICPEGWHIPTDEEWKILEKSLGMPVNETDSLGWDRGDDEGEQLKSGGQSGFNGLMAGAISNTGNSANLRSFGYFWCSTELDAQYAWARVLGTDYSTISRNNYYYKSAAFSVRCVKQNNSCNELPEYWSAYIPGIPDKTVKSQKTVSEIVIDGDVDKIWDLTEDHDDFLVYIDDPQEIPDETDIYISYKTLWDEDYLYFLVDVNDDVLINENEDPKIEPWNDDEIEIYTRKYWNGPDGLPDCIFKGVIYNQRSLPVYENGDRYFHFKWNGDHPWQSLSDEPNEDDYMTILWEQQTKEGQDGYIFEIAIPWQTINQTSSMPSTGDSIGLDMNVLDDDDGDANDIKLKWATKEKTWNWAEYAGILTLRDNLIELPIIKYNPENITLDASDEEVIWKKNTPLNIENTVIGNHDGPGDLSASWRSCYDTANLYLFIDVTDDILRNDHTIPYYNDNIELYFDINNEKTKYYQDYDYQLRFEWDKPYYGLFNGYENVEEEDLLGLINFELITKEGDKGYIYEISIPWQLFGIDSPSEGAKIGIDVAITDNDSGARDAKLFWHTLVDSAWCNTYYFGDAILSKQSGYLSPDPELLIKYNGNYFRNNDTIAIQPFSTEDSERDFTLSFYNSGITDLNITSFTQSSDSISADISPVDTMFITFSNKSNRILTLEKSEINKYNVNTLSFVSNEDSMVYNIFLKTLVSSPLEINWDKSNVSQYGGNDGRIWLEITGGIPPYNILWSTDDTSKNIDNLKAGEYHLAISDQGGLREEMSFDIYQAGEPVYDSDTNEYKTMIIGNQIWMAENLNTGNRIDGAQDQQNNGIIEKYCYDDIETNCILYGGLYQWDEIMQYTTVEGAQGICPDNYHVPSDGEWKILESELGMEDGLDTLGWRGSKEGGKLKDNNTFLWEEPNSGATNHSGMTVLPSGGRDSDGSFSGLGYYTDFWTSTQSGETSAFYRYLNADGAQISRLDGYKLYGTPLRCVYGGPPLCEDYYVCNTGTEVQMHAIGQNITWYENTELTVPVHEGNIYIVTPTSIDSSFYYVTQTMNETESAATRVKLTVFEPLTINIEDQLFIYENNAVNLEGQASGGSGLYQFYWEPSDLIVNPQENVTSTIKLNTTTDIHFTVTDQITGCQKNELVTVTVYDSIESEITGKSAICSGEEISLETSATGGNGNEYSYSWTSDPAGFSFNGNKAIVSPNVTTTYMVEIDDGQISDMSWFKVTVNPLPEAKITSNDTVQKNSTAQLEGSASGGSGNYSYHWQPETMVANPENKSTLTNTLEEDEEFTLMVTDNVTGCSKVEKTTVHVINNISAQIEGRTDICIGESIQLQTIATGGSPENYQYNWTSSPTGFNSDKMNPVVTPEETTTYTVSVEDGSTSNQASATITVHPLPDVNISGNQEVCPYTEELLQYTVKNHSAYTYSWSVSGGQIISGENQDIALIKWDNSKADKSLMVQVENTSSGCTNNDQLSIKTLPSPEKPEIILKGTSLLICPDSGYYAYQWFSNGEPIDGENKQFYYAKNKTKDRITVQTAFENNCKATSDVFNFTKSGRQNDVNDDITIFPNPNAGSFTIKVINAYKGPFIIEILNILGQKVLLSESFKRSFMLEQLFNEQELNEGIYFVHLKYNNTILTKKIIIEKK